MTAQEQKIILFIERYWQQNWTSPTVREIGAHMGWSSSATVARRLSRMVSSGMLERKTLGRSRVLYRKMS